MSLFHFRQKDRLVTQARPPGMKSNCNYKIDHGSIGVAGRGILSAGPFQNSFTAGDDAQGCYRGRGRGQNSRERKGERAFKQEFWARTLDSG